MHDGAGRRRGCPRGASTRRCLRRACAGVCCRAVCPSAKFNASYCDDEPAQVDGLAKLLELGLDTAVHTTRHVQEMRYDAFNRLRGVAGWASVAKRAESDVAKLLNPLCEPPPDAQPQAKDQAERRTAAVSGPAKTPSEFTVCEGWTAPAFKHAHTFTFPNDGYLVWGHAGRYYDAEVIWMLDCRSNRITGERFV